MQSGRALGGARKAESGETLVELLMTVAIVGIAFVAVLGAVFTAIRISDYHRKTTTADIVLRDWAEILKSPGINALGTGYDATFVPCTAGGTISYPAYTPPAPNTAYTAQLAIEYLTSATAISPAWQSTCPVAGEQGAQRLTLTVRGPSTDATVQGRETVTIVKRDVRNG